MFDERIFGVPWSVLVVFALAVAAVYFVVVDMGDGATGIRYVIVRWAHPAVWVLLAIAALAMTRLTPMPAVWAGPIGATGGVLYLVYIAAMLSGRG